MINIKGRKIEKTGEIKKYVRVSLLNKHVKNFTI